MLNFSRAGKSRGRYHNIIELRPIGLRSAHVRLFREADYLKSLVTRLMKPSILSILCSKQFQLLTGWQLK